MQLSDFDYELPNELIARFPPRNRRDSRLLVADAASGEIVDSGFASLPRILRPDDLLVFNDTRVIRARIHGRKTSGGKVEILLERVTGETGALAQLRASKAASTGTELRLPGGATATVTGRDGEFFALEFSTPVHAYLEQYGEVPLPPYLGREVLPDDSERYQTVYAREAGAVAAPTAGLHFDSELMQETLQQGAMHAFVTLHVGAGTFQNLRQESIAANRLHSEAVTVDASVCVAVNRARERGGRVIAVGTTSARALESAAAGGSIQPMHGETDLFIRPGYRFRCVDALLTNFHLPRSSLLMLVAAFAGRGFVLRAYRHAVAAQYRFFSYGDAMFLLPPGNAPS